MLDCFTSIQRVTVDLADLKSINLPPHGKYRPGTIIFIWSGIKYLICHWSIITSSAMSLANSQVQYSDIKGIYKKNWQPCRRNLNFKIVNYYKEYQSLRSARQGGSGLKVLASKFHNVIRMISNCFCAHSFYTAQHNKHSIHPSIQHEYHWSIITSSTMWLVHSPSVCHTLSDLSPPRR